MDDYQRSTVAQFFKPFPMLSPASCHQFVLDQIAPAIFPGTEQADVQPNSFQGSMSYTAILSARGERVVVQFRDEQQDLSGVAEAHLIHGNLVPLTTFRGEFRDLFVYTSCFAEGTPYIQALMASPGFQFTLDKTMVTVMDIADLITRKARVSSAQAKPSQILDGVKLTADNYPFQDTNLRSLIFTCIDLLTPSLHELAALPSVLTHQDLSPFNYLIDEASGQIQAVLDWDGAVYLPVGTNFHFVESFFGYMTPEGWRDSEDRHVLEAAFNSRIETNLTAQGFGRASKVLLEFQKAIGMLEYYMGRILKLRDKRTELYLDGYLQRLSFMR